MIWRIAYSKFTIILFGLTLIGYAIFDIYEELFDPAHEHILLIIGMLLIVSALDHANEGMQIITNSSSEKEMKLLNKVSRFFSLSYVQVILGIAIVISSTYGIYEDYEKIHSKSVSMGVGIITLILPLSKAYIGGEKISKAIKEKPNN